MYGSADPDPDPPQNFIDPEHCPKTYVSDGSASATLLPGLPTGELLDEAGGPALVSAGEDLELLLHLGRPLRLPGHVLPVHLQPLFLEH
jgi:hypothetical protein